MQALRNSLEILILQHPQEAKSPLTTVPLLKSSLERCSHRVGFSWGSLKRALNREEVSTTGWLVLYVGTQKKVPKMRKEEKYLILDKKGDPIEVSPVKGLIVLDGNWKQAKTLWWRNPWLLKIPRMILNLQSPSLYGDLRREPRPGLVSTLEATAYALEALGEKKEVPRTLLKNFEEKIKEWKQLPEELDP